MKILVVHEVDYLEKVIYEIHEFPELLADSGNEVVFFHFQEGAERKKRNLFRKRSITGRTISSSHLTLVGPHQFGVSGIDRIWATVSCVPALIRLFREHEFEVVLNYAVPTYGPQLLLLAKLFKVPVVHRALDSSHEIRQSIFKWPILWAEKLMYRLSPVLSANNSAMMEYCKNLSGRKSLSVVNYPPLDIAHFSGQVADKNLRNHLRISIDDKVITYMGSFFYFSGLPQVIQRFSQLISSGQAVKLLLVGGGEQDAELRKLVIDLNLSEQVIFTGFVSYDELPKYLALSSVAINPLEISRVASIAFPNKVLQYLATGLPVVSTRLEGLASAIDGLGALVWEDSPALVLEKALEIASSRQQKDVKLEAVEGLADLFAPAAALKSLEATLRIAIKGKH